MKMTYSNQVGCISYCSNNAKLNPLAQNMLVFLQMGVYNSFMHAKYYYKIQNHNPYSGAGMARYRKLLLAARYYAAFTIKYSCFTSPSK